MPPELQVLKQPVEDPPAAQPVRKSPRCSTCFATSRVAECATCDAEFCPWHGEQRRCNECWLDAWLPAGDPGPPWSAVALALGMVVLLTTVGVLAGSLFDGLIRTLRPETRHGIVAAIPALLGFGLGWWCFATVGCGWMAEDELETDLEHEE
jgi:hypothetical protein